MDSGIREEILSILDRANDMTIATVRQDGYSQATTVSYANEGLDIYFGCSEESQKARNISRNSKVSLTINLPYESWGEIRGISAGGAASRPEVMQPASRTRARSSRRGGSCSRSFRRGSQNMPRAH